MGKVASDNKESLKWRFDVNTFRLLGRELITDRVTAVFELVKNCYDANATEVLIDFCNISNREAQRRIISISDNGTGMSFSDIRDKWMVVGTNSKRRDLYSPSPFKRKYVGEKGIGRFAVDKLGAKLQIRTKQKGDNKWLNVIINWKDYERRALDLANSAPDLFTDIPNDYYYEVGGVDEHGTSLIISYLNDDWSLLDIERLSKELSKLTSPFYPLNPPFNITINSNEYTDYNHKAVKPDPVKYYTYYKELGYDLQKQQQETLYFDAKDGRIKSKFIDIKDFGPVSIKIYYFDESAKRKYNTAYKNDDTRIDGIKIYRDGIITTPFAEYESDVGKKRDILGIDKRRWGGAFDKVSTREIIGVVDINKNLNPNIIDSTNRQDFLDNKEYRQLKEFIIEQIDNFGELKKYARNVNRTAVERELQSAGKQVKNFTQVIKSIEKEVAKDKPQLLNVFEPLKQQATHLSAAISNSINEQKKYQKDVIRKERIYLSLMSLQEYAANISHAIRTSLGKIKRMAEFFTLNFPNQQLDEFFSQYARIINTEMDTLIKVTDFMLSYASSDIDFEDFSVKDLLEDLLLNKYSLTFEKENITPLVEIKNDFVINANKKFFEDIFQNLVSNSIKALKSKASKVIKCSGVLDDDNFTIYFSDNGYGVNKGDEDWIFDIYNTRTADQGGAGIGLYIVQKRIEALKGSISLIKSELGEGATFKITLPFNRD